MVELQVCGPLEFLPLPDVFPSALGGQRSNLRGGPPPPLPLPFPHTNTLGNIYTISYQLYCTYYCFNHRVSTLWPSNSRGNHFVASWSLVLFFKWLYMWISITWAKKKYVVFFFAHFTRLFFGDFFFAQMLTWHRWYIRRVGRTRNFLSGFGGTETHHTAAGTWWTSRWPANALCNAVNGQGREVGLFFGFLPRYLGTVHSFNCFSLAQLCVESKIVCYWCHSCALCHLNYRDLRPCVIVTEIQCMCVEK